MHLNPEEPLDSLSVHDSDNRPFFQEPLSEFQPSPFLKIFSSIYPRVR